MKHLANSSSIQFIVIGALLFGLNNFVQSSSSQEQDSIVIKQRFIDDLFNDRHNNKINKPSPVGNAETKSAITQKAIEQEALYREALKFNLDKGDQIIRRHLIQKMDFVLNSKSQPSSPPTNEEQYQWWQQHQENYRTPQRVSFHHVYLKPKYSTDSNKLSTQRISSQLDSNALAPADAYQLGDPFLNGHYFQKKTFLQINNLLGKSTATHLKATNKNEWFGPIKSQHGYHWVYLEETQQERTLPYENVTGKVYQDLQEHRVAIAKRAQLNTLISSYNVTYEE
jgi:peptidyl-prolyl cis-trans isomerase C